MNFILPLSAFLLGVLISFGFFRFIHKKNTKDLDARNKALIALRKLDEIMMSSLGLQDVAQHVTDAIAFELKFDIGVLALIDTKAGMLRRVAMSRTTVGLETHKFLPIPYTQILIPLDQIDNMLIQALREKRMKITHSLYDLFRPVLDEETSQKIQNTIGIKTSLIYPVSAKGEQIGVMVISVKKEEKDITPYELELNEKLIDAMGIALDNAKVYQQLRDATQQLAQANEKLHQLDRVKDDFVSVASHELRTPMTAIKSYAWMALNRPGVQLSEKLKKYLVRVLMSTDRLINLVNDMLNISRIESGRIEINPEPVDLISLCKDIIDEIYYSKSTQKPVKFHLLEEKLPKVFADPNKLRQVFLNIAGNALKFSPPDGSITIGFFTDGKVVETYIKDQGPGISKEDIGRLFKKFGRLDNSYIAAATSGGTGLGLFISKRLLDLMHGKIWAESEGVDKGATFKFSLPVASEDIIKRKDEYTISPKGDIKDLEPAAM